MKFLLHSNNTVLIEVSRRKIKYISKYAIIIKDVSNHFTVIIFSKKDSIKACGFRFDSKSKTWYKAIEQKAS